MFDAVRREQETQLSRITEETRARQEAMDRNLAGLSEQTRKLERQMTRRLQDRAATLLAQMRQANAEFRAETR